MVVTQMHHVENEAILQPSGKLALGAFWALSTIGRSTRRLYGIEGFGDDGFDGAAVLRSGCGACRQC